MSETSVTLGPRKRKREKTGEQEVLKSQTQLFPVKIEIA